MVYGLPWFTTKF
ncbi:Anaerobic sulfatase-maturating enzyme, partial [Haemophilus influenzae]